MVFGQLRYLDEFQEPTGELYAMNTYYISGTFSNSVTTNSNAYLGIAIDYALSCLSIYEYSTSYELIWLDYKGE